MKQRLEEFGSKFTDTLLEIMGDRISIALEIGSLGTDPDYQGHGYASALIQIGVDLVRHTLAVHPTPSDSLTLLGRRSWYSDVARVE